LVRAERAAGAAGAGCDVIMSHDSFAEFRCHELSALKTYDDHSQACSHAGVAQRAHGRILLNAGSMLAPQALATLTQIARQVQPIMRRRQWKVRRLIEAQSRPCAPSL